jgi:NAD(P)-dependent dehydrogenase (short-subunit alcohol dehydrogenase family)
MDRLGDLMTEGTGGLMAGKTALVTGGTRGIGRATAEGLVALGARVGITGRNLEQVKAAAAEIASESGGAPVDAFAADMSSLARSGASRTK